MGRRWHALHLRSHHEFRVRDLLRLEGLEEFLPAYKERARWSDRVKFVERPLFPGYIFCRFDPITEAFVAHVRGVCRVVGEVLEHEIDQLRVAAAAPSARPHQFAAGDKVLVERGPLAGLEGVVVRYGRKLRLVVNVPLLRRSVSVEVGEGDVRLAA